MPRNPSPGRSLGEGLYPRIREFCSALPDVTEKLSHGSPGFFVKKRMFLAFANNHHNDGRIAIWCNAADGAQEILVASDPENFFVPPYVGVGGWIGVKIDGDLRWSAITEIVTSAHAASSRQSSAKRRSRG